MALKHRLFFLMIVLALTGGAASAQVQTGTPPFGSFGGGPDVINLANLNAHLTIPAVHKPGRGTDFTYDLSYDTSVWYPVTSGGTTSWQPVTNWGWRGQTEVEVGYVSYGTSGGGQCRIWDPDDFMWIIYNWTIYTFSAYHDSFGVSHPFNLVVEGPTSPCPNDPALPTDATGTTTDGSGYKMSVYSPPSPSATVYSPSGQTIVPPLNTGTGSGTFADRNGNQITADGSGHFYDTLSSTTPVLTVSGSGTASSPMKFTYTAPSGASPYYQFNYTNYTVATNFGVSGISEYRSSTTVPLVTSIVLPDNSQYSLTYEPTPGTCTPYAGTTCVTSRVKSITLTTGGTITYSYSGGNNGILPDGTTATLTRTSPDGTWTYAQVKGTGAASTTTVSDPQSSDTVIQFQGIYETQRQVYQGSHTSGTLLQTANTCYNGASSPCTTTGITLPITQRVVIPQFGSTGLQSKNFYTYNSSGLLTEQDDYDYASGPPTAILRKTLTSYASLGNNISGMPSTVTIQDGSGNIKAQTTYAYDETTPTTTSGTPQHVSITGSRGNATTIKNLVQGTTTFLTTTVSYYDTGNPKTVTDVNSSAKTYNYPNATSTCGNAFPTSVSEPLSLSRSMTWNCTGGVQLTAVDENNQTTTATFNDPYFWRPASITDPANVVTNFSYATSSPYNWIESSMTFNSGNSVSDTRTTLDGLGRVHVQQTRQAPGATNFDSVETDYDALGRVSRVTLPYSAAAGQTNSSAPGTTTTYDALNRTIALTDSGNGSASYTYTQNDTYLSLGPTPTGENAKRRQLEYDGLGRLTSVCEITGATGSGNCAQTSAQTGYWTKYVYDPLGNVSGVTQNAQSTGSQQTRSYSFDDLSRLTSETNPENGTTSYTFDSATGCTGSSSGDLIKRADAQGNTTCYVYDALHRMTSAIYSGPYAGNTPTKNFVYDSATVNSQSMQNAKGRLAEAYTGPSTGKITDLGLSYTARGEVSDVYQSTQHLSGYYYHLTENYWAHGVPSQLSGNIGLPTLSYGVDGEGRPTTTSASSGQNPVTSTSYNLYSSPPQLQVTFGSGDSDTFSYDANTGRMTQYKFTVGTSPQSVVGNLTWNANGSLGQHAITDPFNSANTQTCNYQHEDLSRISQADCGSGGWGQSFVYDPFGNITKNVLSNHTGNSFQPTYSSTTNRITALPGFTPTYDSNGNVLNDSSHQYSPDAEGRPVTLDSVSLTFDALNRMVEQHSGSSYTEIVYAPTGEKLALMSGQTLQEAFVPLPAGAAAVYISSGLDHYRHTDWLGSARLTSTPSRTVSGDTAYAPFGETYAQSGTPDLSFTGQNADTSGGLYDFLYREYSNQGRWPVPDPAGLAAVSLYNPQSWNRYAYVVGDPLNLVDPTGMYYGPCGAFDELCNPSPDGSGGGRGGGGSGTDRNPPCIVESAPDPYTEHVVAGYGLPEDFMEMAPPPPQGCRVAGSGGGGGNSGGGNTSDSHKPNTPYDACISDFYNSLDGKVVQFFAPTALIPGWNPSAWANAKNWAEAIGTKTVVTKLAVAGSNAGKIVNYSINAGTATAAASELSGVVSTGLKVGGKIFPPVAAVATGKDVLGHVGCAVKSVIGFIPTLVP